MNTWPQTSLDSLQKLRNRGISDLSGFLDRRNRLLDIKKREGEIPADYDLADDLQAAHMESIQGSLSTLAEYEKAMRVVEMTARGVNVDNLIYPVEA